MNERKHLYGQFTITYPPIMDGVAMVVFNYFNLLTENGETCIVVTPEASGDQGSKRHGTWGSRSVASQNGSRVLRCASIARPYAKPYVIPVMGPRFRMSLNSIGFDLIHIHYPILMGSFALRLARRKQIPVVATFHTRYREQLRRAIRWRALADLIANRLTRFYEQVDEVWVPSEGAIRVLKEYGYRRDNLRVMPLGTDLDPPDPNDHYAAAFTGRKMVFGNHLPAVLPVVFIYVGNLIITKNLDLLLDSLVALEARGVDFLMILVGDGYHRAAMERFVDRHGIRRRVKFFGTLSDREAIKALLAVSQLFLFPSIADTAGIVRIEAAAFAIASVVVDEACAASGIIDGVNGFISANTAEDYALTIRRAIADRARLEEVGRRAQDTLYRSWYSLVAEVRERYLQLIDEKERAKRASRVDG